MGACSSDTSSSTEASEVAAQSAPTTAAAPAAKQSGKQTLADAPPALRAAVIASAQREAGEAYAVRHEAGLHVAKAEGFDVRYATRGAELGSEDQPHGTLSLAGVGCAEDAAPARAAEPTFEKNRASYASEAGGVKVEEWYLTGPMGLEQGFTVERAPACAANGGELVVEVEATGFAASASGDAVTLRGASGETLRYADLFAKDAEGQALASRLTVTPAGRIALAVDVKGAAWPVEIDPLVTNETQKLTASDGAAGDYFGRSVSVSGDTAVVGVPNATVGANTQQGAAYVYVRSGGTWTEQQKLTASDGAANNSFGCSVSVSGDTAVVGAQAAKVGANVQQGAAYVYVRSGGVWTELQKLTASDGAAGDALGVSVSLSGDTAVVGAYAATVGANGAQGAAYVYVRSVG